MSDLAGRGVAVTRAEESGGPLARRLAARGARVSHWTAVRIAPPRDPQPLERALERLTSYDWLVVTSPRAVRALADRRPVSVAPAVGPRVAAVGESTAAELAAFGWRVDRVGAGAGAEALVEAFAAAGDAAGAQILFPASSQARPQLVEGLTALGARVQRVEAYCTLPVHLDVESCRDEVAGGAVEAVTFTSPSAVVGLERAFGTMSLRALLDELAVVVIGPTTGAALEQRGRAADAVAVPSTLDGLVEATARLLAARPQRSPRNPVGGGAR